MALLIDGYNLLNSVGIVGRGAALGSLERSRLALLNFLAEWLEPEEAARTTVVFDASDPPPGLPRSVEHRGLRILFAARHGDADTLIEQLIREESAPRRLTVVSSDHRLHRAARRRKARAVDSDVWYREVIARRRQQERSAPAAPARPPVPLLEEDVNYWLRQFGGESALTKFIEDELRSAGRDPDDALRESSEDGLGSNRPPDTTAAQPAPPATDPTTSDKPAGADVAHLAEVFPPGYADDLLADEPWADDLSSPFPPGYGEDVGPG